jgi:hypothetical protein
MPSRLKPIVYLRLNSDSNTGLVNPREDKLTKTICKVMIDMTEGMKFFSVRLRAIKTRIT